MRIVAGDLRGRPIQAPEGQEVRPTSDRAREAIFNILEHASWSQGTRDLRVIDLFAGSGAMGLEALSRGAAACLFVELAEASLVAIRANIRAFALEPRTRMLRQDATRLSRLPELDAPYELAFLDPPYAKGLADVTPELARRSGFQGVVDLFKVAKHGPGERVYLVEFEYRPDAS